MLVLSRQIFATRFISSDAAIRTSESPSSSFPFFDPYWTASSALPIAAYLGSCPLVHGARVITRSLPDATFSELMISIDAAPGSDGALQLPACLAAARCSTYSRISADVASDVQRVQLRSNDATAVTAFPEGIIAYVDIPESRAVFDLISSCWSDRRSASFGILLHGPSGCGKTACIKHILDQLQIHYEYFDCATMYERDGSLFTAAVRSVSRRNNHDSGLSGSDGGAVLVLDRVECMFPPLSPHTQVRSFAYVRETSA